MCASSGESERLVLMTVTAAIAGDDHTGMLAVTK